MSYIGLDIGTSGCKAAIVKEQGEVIASAHAKYPLLFPQKGYVELDAVQIYTKVKQVLKELSPHASEAAALAISSFGEAFVLLDEKDRPLNRFITYADARCEGIDKTLTDRFKSEKFFDITGAVPNQSFSLCKLLWMKKNCPEIMTKVKKLFLANDYFNYLLCQNRGVDYGTASKTLLFDVRESSWSGELMEAFGIPEHWFSPVKRVGTCLGELRQCLADELGLPRRLPVYLGCHDQCSATLGGGAYRPGDVMMGEGSTESINLITDDKIWEHSKALLKRNLCVEPYLECKSFMVPSSFLTYGNALKWYISVMEEGAVKQLSGDENLFAYLEAKSGDETSLMFLPNLSSVNLMDPNSRVPGAWIGMTLDTERWEFYRAVIQGLNFESKINLDILEHIGIPVRQISATGGITRSGMFMQLKADIIKRDIRIPEHSEAGINGLAMICAVARGDMPDYGTAVEKFVKMKKVYRPGKDYKMQLKEYIAMRERLR